MRQLSLLVCACWLSFLTTTPVFARHIGKISVDSFPTSPGVNVKTNKVYVANINPIGTVDVIDGASNTLIATIAVGSNPASVAVDELTNRVYVANISDNTVSVIDGASDTLISTIPVGNGPVSATVNVRTNRIYVLNFGDASISVIDGASNQVLGTIPSPGFPLGYLVADPKTNRVYVADLPDAFSVIDGVSNTFVATVRLPGGPKRPNVGTIAIDYALNRIYITDRENAQLFVVNGNDNSILATLPLTGAFDVSVNQATHAILVGAGYGKALLFLDPVTFDVTTTLTSAFESGTAINPVTSEIYVALFYIKTVAVLNAP